MSPSEPGARYTRTAVVLHWLVAGLVIVQFAWGWWMQEIPKEPVGPRVDAFNMHKSVGLTILALMMVRILWRIAHRPPPLPDAPTRASASPGSSVKETSSTAVMALSPRRVGG